MKGANYYGNVGEELQDVCEHTRRTNLTFKPSIALVHADKVSAFKGHLRYSLTLKKLMIYIDIHIFSLYQET